ncbi:MAG: VOC family protein [Candidatus Korobacteraceae bacterium]
MAAPLRLHHVGFVVAGIERAMPGFVRSLAATWDGRVIHDPLQKVKVAFLTTRSGDPQIELVEPAGEDSPVLRFLQQGGGLHHVCYEVANLEEQLSEFRSRGAVIAKRPKPAVAFGGRRIAWVITAEKLLVELLEESKVTA